MMLPVYSNDKGYKSFGGGSRFKDAILGYVRYVLET